MNVNTSNTKVYPALSSLFDDVPYSFSLVPKSIENCKVNKLLLKANENECLINIPKLADYYINKDGVTIEAKTDDEKRFHQISTFADIYAFPAYMYIKVRKDILINASAVKMKDGKAVLFCGVSASGKSTLAYELCKQGAQFIADEYVRLFFENGKVYAKGFYPYFILSQKDLDTDYIVSDKQVYANNNRYIVYQDEYCKQPCEVDKVIILKSSYTERIKAETVISEEKFKIFPSLIYLAELASTFIPVNTLFTQLISIVDNLDIVKIDYCKTADKPEDTVNKILTAIEKGIR